MFKTIHKNQQLIRQKPVIAVIGGAGPDAAIDIQIKLSKSMKDKLNIFSDQDHYRVIVDNNVDLPNRDMTLLNKSQELLQMYIQSAKSLERMGANVLIISCNSAHVYFEEIQRTTSMIMINMIEKTVEYIVQHYQNTRQVGLLSTSATIRGKLYHRTLKKYGIDVIEPDDQYQQKISQSIYGIKAGFIEECFPNNHSEKKLKHVYQNAMAVTNCNKSSLTITEKRSPRQLLQDTIVHLIDKGAKLIILGCTELPLVVKKNDFIDQKIHIIDPTLILAQSTIQKCIDLEHPEFFKERQATICVG